MLAIVLNLVAPAKRSILSRESRIGHCATESDFHGPSAFLHFANGASAHRTESWSRDGNAHDWITSNMARFRGV